MTPDSKAAFQGAELGKFQAVRPVVSPREVRRFEGRFVSLK